MFNIALGKELIDVGKDIDAEAGEVDEGHGFSSMKSDHPIAHPHWHVD
ncbi:MAG: hypothetical protein IPL99_15750 [Candidatus Competibacteraceae bacterium]|nr:hypothetical protein [Candidatus Competibacteraceae bacterium]